MEYLERQRMSEHERGEAERHEEHHEGHAGRHAEQARESFQDAGVRAGGGQHDVAGTRCDGGHDREQKKRQDVLRDRTLPP